MMRQKRKSPNIKSRKKSQNIKSRKKSPNRKSRKKSPNRKSKNKINKKSHMISSLPSDIKEKLYNTGMNLKKNDNLTEELKHFTKKALIKSSKRLGNSKQNDNIITDEDLVYFSPEELEEIIKHFTKKELIKSSKHLGNSKQNDNLITDEDLVYLSPEELKHYTKKFKDYFSPEELKHFTKKELIKSSNKKMDEISSRLSKQIEELWR
jgi:hypothetical protein